MEFLAILLLLTLVAWLETRVYQKYAFHNLKYVCYFDREEAFEGEEICLVEEVSNGKLLPMPWLKAELTTSKWLDFAGSQSLITEETRFVPSFFMMKSRHKVVRSWKVKCLKRGSFQLDKVILVSTDLLGTVSVSLSVDPHTHVTVLPRPVDMELGFERVLSTSGPVIVRRHLLPDPFLIAGVREYTQRESMNHIHWLATARTGRLMVHNNEYSADQTLTIIHNIQSREYELERAMEPEKVEEAIRVCAGFLDDTLRSGIPVSLWINASLTGERETIITPCSWGREHIRELLRLLANLPLQSSEDFPTFLEGFCSKVTTSDLVLISPYLNEDILEYAGHRRMEGTRVKVVTTSPLRKEDIKEDLDIYCYHREEAVSHAG